jgi:threonine dehydratase
VYSLSGAGAAAAAAVLAGKVDDKRDGARVIAIVSGRNVTADTVRSVVVSATNHPESERVGFQN